MGKEDNPNFIDRQRRHTAHITDAYFCRRTPDGDEERVPYNSLHIAMGRQYLGVRVETQIGDEATLYTTGHHNVRDLLGDLGITPSDLLPAIGRRVNAYGDTAIWGIWVPPIFAR